MADVTHWSTWSEIHAQPAIWRAWAAPLAAKAQVLRAWITARGIEEVWLCGAGTSGFVGEICAWGARPDGLILRAVATTDFVSNPQDFLPVTRRLLVVQFGRSGDSSESVGMIDLLDRLLPAADRLHITCNPAGALATRAAPGPGERRVLCLPDTTHDAGFAMTASFSTMLLSALATLDDRAPDRLLPQLADSAEAVLAQLSGLYPPRPARVVFLGSGALRPAARESALKVLELTAGRTVAQWDSALGFRHGPKAVVTDDTHLFVFLHPDPHSARYDRDIAAEIRHQFPAASVTTVGPGGDIALTPSGDARCDAVLYVLVAQVLGVRWSHAIGLNVDNPFEGGALNRVVSGVTLYGLPA